MKLLINAQYFFNTTGDQYSWNKTSTAIVIEVAFIHWLERPEMVRDDIIAKLKTVHGAKRIQALQFSAIYIPD